MGKFMKEGPLDNWGFGTGIKLTRQELIEDARVQYVRAENILKSNTELIAKNDKLKADNEKLREALEKILEQGPWNAATYKVPKIATKALEGKG